MSYETLTHKSTALSASRKIILFMAELSQWEGSKENVQPSRKGRKPSDILKALSESTSQSTRDEENTTKIAEFEKSLSEPHDDPLSVWILYLEWMRVTFVQGTHKQNITKILERCTQELKDNEQYKNDPRYIEIWIEYARQCRDPKDIYLFMDANLIGQMCAPFHIAYAEYLELIGDCMGAAKVYQQGIALKAAPIDILKRRRHEFQKRMVDSMKSGAPTNPLVSQSKRAVSGNKIGDENRPSSGNENSTRTSGNQEKKRITLNPLSEAEAKSFNRPSSQREAPTLSIATATTGDNTARKSQKAAFEVFSGPSVAEEKPKWTNLPPMTERTKENDGVPVPMAGQTIDAGLKHRPTLNAQPEPISRSRSGFQVMEDS